MDINNDGYVTRYSLSEATLERIIQDVERVYGVKVLKIKETEGGYVLLGKYGFSIGDITFNYKTKKYNQFNFHRGVVELIDKKNQEVLAKRKKYKVQRTKRRVTLTAAGLAVLISLGVVAGKHISETKALDANPSYVAVETERQHLNTITTANDLLLVNWANYAMGRVSDVCSNSEYDAIQVMRDDVYANLFVPVMSNYYDYLDYNDSPLPDDMVGDLMSKKHERFRMLVADFDDYLTTSPAFSSCAFSQSPFVNAVVVDKNGNVIGDSIRYYGETFDNDGKLVTYDDNLKIFIRADDVPNSNYSISNLPSDTMFLNGVAYVSSEHLNEFEKTLN